MADKPNIQQVVPGLTITRHTYLNGYISEYTVMQMSQHVIDAWIAKIKEDIELHPDQHIRFSIHDVSQTKNIMVPPYLREKTKAMTSELAQKGIKITSYNALILPRNFMTHFVRLLLMNTILTSNTGSQQIFFSRDEGFAWLQEKLRELTSSGD